MQKGQARVSQILAGRRVPDHRKNLPFPAKNDRSFIFVKMQRLTPSPMAVAKGETPRLKPKNVVEK